MTPVPPASKPQSFPRQKLRGWLLLTLALALPALYLLARPGFFVSDDGRFHVYRVAALARAWLAGVLHPRLFPEFGFGYGQAVLNFYAPLSYWPGALLSVLHLNPATATEFTIGLVILLASAAMFFYVRSLWGPAAGVVAAILYTYYPYHLIDAYVRGAMPELAAFIFPPLIFWAYTRGVQAEMPRDSHRALLWGALAWAGLVFTHNLSALLMTMAFVPYVLLIAWRTKRWRRLVGVAFSLVLALAMTAVYWMPVLAESRAVGLGGGPSGGYEKHLLAISQLIAPVFSHDYAAAYQGPITHPQNWLTVVILLLASGLLTWRWHQRRSPAHSAILIVHLLLAVVAIFMTTTLSLMVWRPLTPILGYLQYPWRFLYLAAVGVAVSGGALVPLFFGPKSTVQRPKSEVKNLKSEFRPLLLIALVFILAMLTSLPKLPYEPLPLSPADTWFPERMWQEDAEMGQVGATWTGEFLPRSVTEERWALGLPRQDAADGPMLAGPPRAEITSVQHLGLDLLVDTSADMPLRLHQFMQPGWNASLDSQPADIRASDEMGLATVDVFAGQHDTGFLFGHTLDRVIGAWLAALAALLWGLWAWRSGKRWIGLRGAAISVVVVTAVLMLNSGGVGRASHTPAPVQVQVGDVAQILASDVSPARVPGYLEVTIYWLALKENAADYHVFVHVLDGAGQVVAQHDGFPVGGFTPTTRWRPGEIIKDAYHIPLPPGYLPGTYTVKAGMYAYADTIRNLPTNPPQPDDRVDLGAVELQP